MTSTRTGERFPSERFPSMWSLYRDAERVAKRDREAIAERQQDRLADLISFARRHSRFYRDRYRGLPERVDDPTVLPVTTKAELMAHFDDWLTDQDVTLDRVTAHLADPDKIGELIDDRYLVTTTSGTSGTRGIFVLDDRYWAVATAQLPVILRRWLTPKDIAAIIARRGRFAQLIATGGHYMSYAANQRTQRTRQTRHRPTPAEGRSEGRSGGPLQVFSVHSPMTELVPELNEFDPALLWGYASVVALLSEEQATGRLRIRPRLVICAAEGLPDAEYTRIAAAFDCTVRNLYGGTESGYAAYGCGDGWLHLLQGWVILEPVDADYQPTPPGTPSHTVLLTNLANRVQPILRYDLGDSILLRPDPCPCGDPAPAIQVKGRAADTLTFPPPDGTSGPGVTVTPLAFSSLLDRVPGVTAFQIVQAEPTQLRLRLTSFDDTTFTYVQQRAIHEIRQLLTRYQLRHVTIEADPQPPHRSPGGKYRSVVPYHVGQNEPA